MKPRRQFWFTTYSTTLTTLARLPANAAGSIETEDWKQLAESLPPSRKVDEVGELFYPGQLAPSSAYDANVKRRAHFLRALNDDDCWKFYQHVSKIDDLKFPNVFQLDGINNEQKRKLFRIMTHVVSWVNPSPTVVGATVNEKPALRTYMLPALQDCDEITKVTAEKRMPQFTWDLGHHPLDEAVSILLQQEVLQHALADLTAFTKDNLDQPLGDTSERDYTWLFRQDAWASVLDIVCRYKGTSFREQWSPGAEEMERAASKTRFEAMLQDVLAVTEELDMQYLQVSDSRAQA
jgi:hypothetical protein